MDIVTLGAALNGSAEYVNSHFKGGSNIQIVDNPDGTQTINASGEVSAEDTVARADIAAIKDGETLDSFGDVETALATKANASTTYTKTEVDTALGGKVDKETGKGLSTNDYTTAEKTKLAGIAEGAEVNEIEGIKVNNTTINPDANKVVNITVPTTAADVSALPDTTKYAAALSLTINSSTFVMTGQLKDQNGDNLGTAQTIDLPLESVVVGGSYNSQSKKVVLTLQNGNTIEFSVADLVSGLQTELSASNKLNPAYINYDSTHRAVSDTEKSTWNGKQDALSTAQLAAANSGITSADVEQITTNKNNILSLDEEANALANNDRKNIITLYSFPMIVGGVTITQDLDTGELVFNGTASGTGFHYAYIGNAAIESGKMYGFVDSLYGGNTLYAYVGSISVFNDNYPAFLPTRGNRVAIADGYPSIVVRLVGGTTYNNQRLSPMLFAGEITDNTYQPPAETNAHLTQQLQYAQFRRIKDNTSTVTFNLKRTDTQDRYHYGFVLFGNVTNLPSIYAVFIGAESTNPTVSFAKVGGGIEGALTGSVEYNGLNVTLTITSTSTLYGGIRLVWLD